MTLTQLLRETQIAPLLRRVAHYPNAHLRSTATSPQRLSITARRFAPARNCVARLLLVHGRLAQLVARFLHTEEAVGSSPASPTKKFEALVLPAPQMLSTGNYRTQLRLLSTHSLRHALLGCIHNNLLGEILLFFAVVDGLSLPFLSILDQVAQRLV